MQIKKLTPQEIDTIIRLDARFKSHWSEDTYAERLELFPELSYGAYVGKRLIGFIIGKRDDTYILISRIVVNEFFEGQGIGSKLLETVVSNGAKFRAIVRANNLRSLNLHMHHGFAVSGNYEYSNGDAGFILEKY